MKTVMLVVAVIATILGSLMAISCPPAETIDWNFETNVIGMLIAIGGYQEAKKLLKELDNE